MNESYIVYIHTNKINGKKYVGITSKTCEERWRDGRGYKRCTLFNKAIKKYGWDGFDHEIVASNLTQSEAEDMEKSLIAQFQTTNPEFGYNLSEGGHAPLLSEETKQKISEALRGENNPMFGHQYSEEEKERLSEKMSGANHPRYGIIVDNDVKQKISQALKGGHGKRSVICVETGEIFQSITEAAKAKNIKHISQIVSSAKGAANSAGGYHWQYYPSSIS